MATQAEIANNMIRQLRLLDPSVSAEIGTPERKIIDTVAQELANAQIDLNQLNSAFDLDSKFGSDLDAFLSIFGFARQTGSQATGYVTFSRAVTSAYAIPIPQGTQVTAASIGTDGGATVALTFATTAYGEISKEALSVTIPVKCLQTGTIGNVAANTITGFARTPILGVTAVTNDIATSGGTDVETDAALKVRFKNTVFRNLAGTEDQYLALAVSTAFTTKANAVGPISRYQEYIQVPDVADSQADPDSGVAGNGSSEEWTTALSTIPYSQHVYDTLPIYVTTGSTTEPGTFFYRNEVDFRINTSTSARDKGDTYRARVLGTGLNVNTDPLATYQPNISFLNTYTGENSEVEAIRAGDILLFEHSYMSDASRNNWERQILNCVDVFINGQNPVQSDAITVKPGAAYASTNQFVTNSNSRFYIENYRRVGDPERRPVAGNFFMPLFWTPIMSLPETIVTSEGTYINGVHYWAIEDVSEIGRTVRARTGIEWNPTIKAQLGGDSVSGQYTGPTLLASTDTSLEVTGYTYDRNIVDLQASIDANKPVTVDALAHQSKTRYFKLDLTVMYTPGASVSGVNTQIREAIQTFFEGAYFGTTIQLSDILQVVHNIAGVDNVRWSRDITEKAGGKDASGNPRYRVVEVDNRGYPIANFLIDRLSYGSVGTTEVQIGYLTGNPTNSTTYKLKYEAAETAAIKASASATTIKSSLEAKSIPIASVSGGGTALNPFVFTFNSTGYRSLLETTANQLYGSTTTSATTVFDSDFFLKDNHLPSLPSGELSTDTLPGLIIRKRAQNTWGAL